MESSGLMLSGQDLTLSDLVKIAEGVPIKLDPEVTKLFQTTLPSNVQELLLDHSSSTYLSIIINNLLKNPASTSKDFIDAISEIISTKNNIPLKVSDNESKFLHQSTYKICSELVLSLKNFNYAVPLLDGALGLMIEAENQDSSIADEENFSITTQGLRTTLSNLQSFLNDSKLAKKNSPTETVTELIHLSGAFKDVLEDSEKILEKETNAAVLLIKKNFIKRSNIQLIKILNQIVSITSQISAVMSRGLPTLQLPLEMTISNILSFLQSLQNYSSLFVQEIFTVLLKYFTSLQEFEEKINKGANKPRPLQLGKGSRSLYQYLKETPASIPVLSQFLSVLLLAKNEERRVPKIAKGMRDYASEEMNIREYVFNTIRGVFKKHMASELDTPVMELRETLTGKYGEEGSKLIYNLSDQGGELLSLRYDLTVPFARYVAMNRITNWKRFQIGKVYRRDQPQMKRGRYREFYQCDFDIVGSGSVMAQDAEVLKIVVEILHKLEFNFIVKINHRKLLDAFLDISGCPSEKYRTVSSSIDKLDKEEWAKVRAELVNEKGITEDCADKIGEYVKLNGYPPEVLSTLQSIEVLNTHAVAKKALEELSNLLNFCECLGILKFLSLDMSLARGLDYYTGLVYEAVVVDGSVGSIAGGGRYDELIMRLNNSNQPTPAVGVSLGVERLFTVIEERIKAAKEGDPQKAGVNDVISNKFNSVLVAQAGNSDRFNLIQERYKICNQLWAKGINAETSYKEKSDPKGQAGYASQQGMRWIVWLGESELVDGKVKIKDLNAHNEELINVNEVAEFILSH